MYNPQVQAPPGTVIGYVTQDAFGILRPWFSIQNAEGDTVLKIKGPVLGCSCYSDANFDVRRNTYLIARMDLLFQQLH